MRRLTLTGLLAAAPGMAFASEGPFFSLGNAHLIELIGFLLFIGVLVWLGVPRKVGEMLDARAETIRAELEEARRLREEAEQLLATYERRRREVREEAERIVAAARHEAEDAAAEARRQLEETTARRLRLVEEEIAAAEANAVREVREHAVDVAIETARDVLRRKLTAKDANQLIDRSIELTRERLH